LEIVFYVMERISFCSLIVILEFNFDRSMKVECLDQEKLNLDFGVA